jgi:hypothetical protein
MGSVELEERLNRTRLSEVVMILGMMIVVLLVDGKSVIEIEVQEKPKVGKRAEIADKVWLAISTRYFNRYDKRPREFAFG